MTTASVRKPSTCCSAAPLAEGAGDIRRLQRENEYLRRQREILKKAMGILSEDPPSSMR